MQISPPDLTPAQEVIFEPGIRVIDAGPGAGKTRALTARFIAEVLRGPRGVGFVSFTNAAVEEVRARTAAVAASQTAPHFIGTIDSFLHRFIVTPAVVAKLGKLPTYLSSWNDLPDGRRKTLILKDVPGRGIELANFAWNGGRGAIASSLAGAETGYLKAVDDADRRSDLLAWAGSLIDAYMKAGVLDSATARTIAFTIASGPRGSRIQHLLKERFQLLLVDEVQDCNRLEMDFLQAIAADVPTVFVADPDQAIYQFRGSDPNAFLDLRDSVPKGYKADLLENHRSTSAICKAVSSLRSPGRAEIRPYSPGPCAPVILVSGTQSDAAATFRAELDRIGIPHGDAIVLAHKKNEAFRTAGIAVTGDGRAAGDRIARAACTLAQRGLSPNARLTALRAVERAILSLVDWPAKRPSTRAEQLDCLNRDSYWLRGLAGQLIGALNITDDPSKFARDARSLLGPALSGLPVPTVQLSSRLKRPAAGSLPSSLPKPGMIPLAADSIHQVKGREFPAVLIGLYRLHSTDGRNAIDDWRDQVNSEARRVLYVAVSRAQRLVAFAGPPGRIAEVGAILDSAQVPSRRA